MKQRSLLSRLRQNGVYYLIGALILIIGVPLYQFLVLTPSGYGEALNGTGTSHITAYLTWIANHNDQFLLYRALLVIAFGLLFTLPFTLFRIIVAQELVAQMDEAEEAEEQDDGEEQPEDDGETDEADEEDESEQVDKDGVPTHAWRGKGFAIIAAWSGFFGVIAYVIGTTASTFYLTIVGSTLTPGTALPSNFTTLNGIFSLTTNTVSIGLLALSTLFFGVVIARRGLNLWPGIWVAFGYLALAVTALLSGSAVAATTGQSALASPAILLFALWVLWFSIMLVRLKPE
jgi:hypothetical protein